MKKSAIILAGGFAKRLGQDKGLAKLAGKPLILHVLDRIFDTVDEVVIVVSSIDQVEQFTQVVGQRARVIIDEKNQRSPLVGALTGFKKVLGDYSLLLSCDTPFISNQIVTLFFELCVYKTSIIPRWPNGFIEPLQAVYHTKSARVSTQTSLENNKFDLQSMIGGLKRVLYISTESLQQIDSKLLTFLNINTSKDLKTAKSITSTDLK